MTEPSSTEAAKRRAAEQAGDNHDLGVDGDDPSHADTREAAGPGPGGAGGRGTDPAQVERNIREENPA